LKPTAAALLAIVLLTVVAAGPARAGEVQLLSRANPAGPPKAVGSSGGGLISQDGRWIAFTSSAPDLLPGQNDGNNDDDVFLWDRTSATLTLVSHAAGSATLAANGRSIAQGISPDGRYVAFISTATNLFAGENSAGIGYDLFLWDRTAGTTALVSHRSGDPAIVTYEADLAGMSDDGRSVAFLSSSTELIAGGTDTNGGNDLFLWDGTTGAVTLVSHGAASATTAANGEALGASLSGDGRWIAFASRATDMIAGGSDTNHGEDAFLWDRTTGSVTLLSHADGDPATAVNANSGFPVISRDGNWIALQTGATNLMPGLTYNSPGSWNLFLRERATGATTLITHTPGSPSSALGNSASRPALSDDGAWVAFGSTSTNLVGGQVDGNGASDIFLWERATGTNTLVSHSTAGPATAGNGGSFFGSIATDGSRVAFWSGATDLVSGGADGNGAVDAFLWERASGAVTLVSHTPAGPAVAGNGVSYLDTMSADGGVLVFSSSASDLAAGDTNGGSDAFVWERATGTVTALSLSPAAVSTTPDGGVDDWLAPRPSMLSADGRFAVYRSPAQPPGQNDPSHGPQVFLFDRLTGTTTLVSHSTGSPTTRSNDRSDEAVISADGRWVAFSSRATDLIPGFIPDQLSSNEIYLWDRLTGTTTLVSFRAGSPTQGGCLSYCSDLSTSADGRFIAYSKVFSIVVFDRTAGTSQTLDGDRAPRLSADGRYLAYIGHGQVTGQTGPAGENVFLFDRLAATATLVSHSSGSALQGGNAASGDSWPALSADGRYVTYDSRATDLVPGQTDTNSGDDIFLYDRATGSNTLISHTAASPSTAGNGRSVFTSWISADGRWIAFSSLATDLAAGATDANGRIDAFLFDRVTGSTALLSHKAGHPLETATGDSTAVALSADGSTVALSSNAPDLLAGVTDLNGTDDLVLIHHPTGAVELASRSLTDPATAGNGRTYRFESLSAEGRVAAFPSYASDLAAGDRNLALDLFAYVGSLQDYFTLTPCRLLDTRQPQGGPALASGVARTVTAAGACGIPAEARALAVNITVTGPTGAGYLTVHPGKSAAPVASTLNFVAGVTRANNAIVPLAIDGTLALEPLVGGGGTVHVIVDVVGYFAE
jgi:Tol biopolymer transport system component